MVPEFDVKQINSKVSHDFLSNLFALGLLASVAVYVILAKELTHTDALKFAIIAGMVLLQVVSHFIPKVKEWDFINSGGLGGLLVYNIAIGMLFLWFIPLYSPFVLILPAIIFITIYYRGISGFFLSTFALLIIITLVTVENGYPAVPLGRYYPVLTLLLGVIFAGIIQRISGIDNQVRSEFRRISTRVELDREQLNSLISNLTEAIVATDREGSVLFHNDAATELLGAEAPLTGKQFSDLTTLYDKQDQAVDILQLAREQVKDIQPENLHILNSRQEKLNLYIDIAPISSGYTGGAQGFIILLRDITKEKTLDEQRDEFIAVTADELRNPIAIAEGNISVVLSSDATHQLDPTIKPRLQQAHTSITLLGDLVNQLDLLHRAETKALDLAVAPINVTDLIQKVVDGSRHAAADKGLQLLVNIATPLNQISNSEEYVAEILQKYVSNAIKYSSTGAIHIRAVNGEPGTIIFSVADNGVGIGQSDKPKLFHKFYRSEDFHTRQTRGTGLGLYIVLKIANQLQAKVWFESEINKGSTFFVQVPSLNIAEQAPSPTPVESTKADKPL